MLNIDIDSDWMSLQEAAHWASQHTGKAVTVANISYLVQYGRINKATVNGLAKINQQELIDYYRSYKDHRKALWSERLGDDLNWTLSFDQYKEAETTKHVHRLHPYKGKFIPQLVEYFLDSHTDDFKTKAYFKPGDIVIDPFSGSGRTLVQAAELGIHAVGVDVSIFNTLIGNSKLSQYDLPRLKHNLASITNALSDFVEGSQIPAFEQALLLALKDFNAQYFPSPLFKQQISRGDIDEEHYATESVQAFLPHYYALVKKYQVAQLDISEESGTHRATSFLDTWYLPSVRAEMKRVLQEVDMIKDPQQAQIIRIILSRTLRSCRATTHADLATLQKPITAPYYCSKHGKICKPVFSLQRWWGVYVEDTFRRLLQFESLRTPTWQICLSGDSRELDVLSALQAQHPLLAQQVAKRKIKGVFSSPPYVGLIDYHEQHAYAYELFGFERQDEREIGPLQRGQGRVACEAYVQGISSVLNNVKRVLSDDFDIFLVANDKHNLYPKIAQASKLNIVEQFKRPVLNRTEKDKGAYAETIFHLKAQ